MHCWASSFSISNSLKERLEALGVTQDNPDANQEDHSGLLLVYSPPDQIISRWRLEQETPPELRQIAEGFKRLSSIRATIKIAEWRLNSLDNTSIIRLLNGEQVALSPISTKPTIKPLAGLITLKMLQEEPDILSTYQDFELQSMLLGDTADSHYLRRIDQSICCDILFQDWWMVNEDRETSHEDSLLNLERLHQVQREYDDVREQLDAVEELMQQQNHLVRKTLVKFSQSKK